MHFHFHSTGVPLPRVPWTRVPPDAERPRKRVVLVTGAAGFIGLHVCLALQQEWGAKVIGIDNFITDYDPQLKVDRAEELMKSGVQLFRGDVCDRTLLKFLFEKFNFTGVVHLAAHAGVRCSVETPVKYLWNNVECFLALLHTIKDYQVRVI